MGADEEERLGPRFPFTGSGAFETNVVVGGVGMNGKEEFLAVRK